MQNDTQKPGRPRFDHSDRKWAHQIYCTDAEWEIIQKRAKKNGEAASQYIVRTVLKANK
jgi:hypothetical protein